MSQALRATPDRKQADAWTLALASQGIHWKLERRDGAWVIWVDELDAPRAAVVLDAFERENAARPRPRLPPVDFGPTPAGWLAALGLAAFYLITGPRDPAVPWFAHGSASAAAILDGELWRTVTALTLHADFAHVFTNTVFCALFASLVCRTLGPGLGIGLILLAGTLGNALNALVQGPPHDSVGASTAIFGAVGILGGLQGARWHLRAPRRSAWLPVAGALALLAMLGMGEHTDISAHFLGLGVGAGLGLPLGLALRRPAAVWAQGLAGVAALAALGGCWALAFRWSSGA